MQGQRRRRAFGYEYRRVRVKVAREEEGSRLLPQVPFLPARLLRHVDPLHPGQLARLDAIGRNQQNAVRSLPQSVAADLLALEIRMVRPGRA